MVLLRKEIRQGYLASPWRIALDNQLNLTIKTIILPGKKTKIFSEVLLNPRLV